METSKAKLITDELYYEYTGGDPLFNLENIDKNFLTRKNWGFKYEISKSSVHRVECCYIVQGGFSSWHYHKYAHNTFFVPVGYLEITFEINNLKRSKYIGPREHECRVEITPGIWHKFKAYENTILIENYINRNFDDDIVRDSERLGGINV